MPATTFDELRIGEAIGEGLFAVWTLVAKYTNGDESTVLVVRPHRYHPFVTERISFQDGTLIAWSGSYHSTLIDAMNTFEDRISRISDREFFRRAAREDGVITRNR